MAGVPVVTLTLGVMGSVMWSPMVIVPRWHHSTGTSSSVLPQGSAAALGRLRVLFILIFSRIMMFSGMRTGPSAEGGGQARGNHGGWSVNST